MTNTSVEGSFTVDPAIVDSWEDDEEVDDIPDSYAEPELLLPS